MRVSCGPEALALVLSLSILARSADGQSKKLDPAFRLPAGGVAAAGPLVDTGLDPPAAWLLSEDRSLYLLTQDGELAAHIVPEGEPSPFLALDPFSRVLAILDDSWLVAYTRTGREAWRTAVTMPSGGRFLAPAFGSDGRAFFLSGADLVCLNPAGKRLWKRSLPAAASCAPGVDGAGRPVAGMVDGTALILDPYGGIEALVDAGAAPASIAPLAPGPGLPSLGLGLPDGRILLVGDDGKIRFGLAAGKAAILSIFWDGAAIYGLDASGTAFALTAGGSRLWSTETGCRDGRLSAYPDRLIARGAAKASSMDFAGRIFREITIPNGAGLTAISPSGLAFSPGVDWVLAAYRFEQPLGQPRAAELEPYPFLQGVAEEEETFDPRARESARQLALLGDIEKSLRSGTIGEDEPWAAAYCSAVALGRLEAAVESSRARFAREPLPRARAVFLLGEMGSPAYRDVLAQVLERDPDEAVQGAACDALAAIGVDPGGLTAKVFLDAASRPVDERVAFALIVDMERMALRSGTPPGSDAVRAFLKLAAKPYASAVRDRASIALGRIAGTVR